MGDSLESAVANRQIGVVSSPHRREEPRPAGDEVAVPNAGRVIGDGASGRDHVSGDLRAIEMRTENYGGLGNHIARNAVLSTYYLERLSGERQATACHHDLAARVVEYRRAACAADDHRVVTSVQFDEWIAGGKHVQHRPVAAQGVFGIRGV